MQTRQEIEDEYRKIKDPAWAECLKTLAECEKIRKSAFAKYEKIREPAWDKMHRKIDELDEEINPNK